MEGAGLLGHDRWRRGVRVVQVRSDLRALGDDAFRLRVVDRGERVRREGPWLGRGHAERLQVIRNVGVLDPLRPVGKAFEVQQVAGQGEASEGGEWRVVGLRHAPSLPGIGRPSVVGQATRNVIQDDDVGIGEGRHLWTTDTDEVCGTVEFAGGVARDAARFTLWRRERMRWMFLTIHAPLFLYQLLPGPRASSAHAQSSRRHLTLLGMRHGGYCARWPCSVTGGRQKIPGLRAAETALGRSSRKDGPLDGRAYQLGNGLRSVDNKGTMTENTRSPRDLG